MQAYGPECRGFLESFGGSSAAALLVSAGSNRLMGNGADCAGLTKNSNLHNISAYYCVQCVCVKVNKTVQCESLFMRMLMLSCL